MSFDARPTDFSAARIRETVQEILGAGILPSIVQAGHPVLRHVAAPFEGQLSDAELGHLIDLMRSVMHKAPGVGLAAPQLGIPLQLAVLEDQFAVDPDVAAVRGREPLPFFAMLNPRYQPVGSGAVAFYEGCLSIGGLQAAVLRPESIRLNFTAPDGTELQRPFSGWQARIVQHETDHLRGILFLDRAELRSISNNAEYASRWAQPDITRARQELGFLPDPTEF
ncbi:peptide deformylase [Arthrobacter oryzae]|uniref:Peptide deformylase n=1 Tax=Arthrobacter oryzae TaxID=409290 RepID=A0A495FNF1_9MICC|nr:peptide deformylase [Arthrobacter oryzae]RKR30267.1 peptide deformylase [Arthrobacter oryzae]